MSFDSLFIWLLERLIAYPTIAVFILVPMGILGTWSVFATAVFQLAHKIAMLTSTNKDDEIIDRMEQAWEKITSGPFGFIIKFAVRYAYIKPPK